MTQVSGQHVLLVANAAQSRGPVPSGLMLEGSAHLAGSLLAEGYEPLVFDFNTLSTVRTIALALADAQAADPIADREIATRTSRALTRIVQPPSDKQLSTAVRSLRQRSDPLLIADLPQPMTSSTAPTTVLIGEHLPGNAEIHDAVPLGNGTILLALGELGCRLLTADGRIKARSGSTVPTPPASPPGR